MYILYSYVALCVQPQSTVLLCVCVCVRVREHARVNIQTHTNIHTNIYVHNLSVYPSSYVNMGLPFTSETNMCIHVIRIFTYL